LAIAGFILWMLSFYNYINDLEESSAVFTQDAIEVLTALFQLTFFILVNFILSHNIKYYFIKFFYWTRQIPNKYLDLHRRAESKGDKVLIFGSTLFLSAECICEVAELLFFSFRHKHTHLIIKLLDIIYSISSSVNSK
jgi:hypothetical protein